MGWRDRRKRKALERLTEDVSRPNDLHWAQMRYYQQLKHDEERQIRLLEEECQSLQESIKYMDEMGNRWFDPTPPDPEPVSDEEAEAARRALEDLCRP